MTTTEALEMLKLKRRIVELQGMILTYQARDLDSDIAQTESAISAEAAAAHAAAEAPAVSLGEGG